MNNLQHSALRSRSAVRQSLIPGLALLASLPLVSGLSLASPLAALPHDGHDHEVDRSQLPPRTWTLVDGTQLFGHFLSCADGRVRIQCEDGSTAAVGIDELDAEARALIAGAMAAIESLNHGILLPEPGPYPLEDKAQAAAKNMPYDAFAPEVRTRRDERWLYVESRGWPAHPMMAGIRTWQQQVPLPQPYTGDNAWRIPLAPKLADKPVSGKTALMRGAVALAANGVPIFNALNNRGEDAYKIGELDQWGGHCGRSDDYHYHVAPLHLLDALGKDSPLGHALDGFPLYGLFDPKQPATCPLGATDKLDELNGHAKQGGLYHYHSSLEYPYINGGVRGVVDVVGDQIDPQPRAAGVREALQALRGASIVEHKAAGDNAWSLRYTLDKAEHRVDYIKLEDGRWQFDFVAPDGTKRTEVYGAQRAGGGRGNEGGRAGEGGQGGGERRGQGQGGGRGGQGQGGGQGGRGGQNGGAQNGGTQGGPRGPAEGGPQLPWILAHAKELDTDADGAVARAEMLEQAEAAFKAYDANSDGAIDAAEQGGRPPRLPMGGFVGLHAKELDADGDGAIAHDEMIEVSVRMFNKSDSDGDGRLADQELTKAPQQGRGGQRGQGQGGQGQGGQGQGGRGQGGGGRDAKEGFFHDEVPAHPWDIVLSRPGTDEITITVLSSNAVEGWIEYGVAGGERKLKSPKVSLVPETPALYRLTGLAADTAYEYAWRFDAGGGEPGTSEVNRFRTQRPAGASYTYTIIADSHLDENAEPAAYERTLAAALADAPDFHVDLGDTFMTDKRREWHEARAQYYAQRYWYGKLARSAPLFLVIGNHDGEYGYQAGGKDAMAPWSHALRTTLFPNPVPGGIYTGNATPHPLAGLLQDYYAWTWGDALHIVLDPFWPTTVHGRRDTDNWERTLGREQYDWLSATLAGSKAKYVFVYIHHLVGGRGKDNRGGVESAGFYEWGGKGEDGVEAFAQRRPGWPKPIHALLVEHKVSAVFHGHDHLYVHNQLDGLVYQCVPQPGNSRGGTQSAAQYGYESGTILSSPGHIRVQVGPELAKVEFLQGPLENRRGRGGRNDAGPQTAAPAGPKVAHSWTVEPRKLQPATGAPR